MEKIGVTFPDKKIENSYEELKHSKNEQERFLYKQITTAIEKILE